MYQTEEFISDGHPHVVRMSFELPYLDWCRFEKSEIFQNLIAYLEKLKNQYIPTQPLEDSG